MFYNGLEYLKTHGIITQEEYTKYVAYTPTVDGLLKTLEQEGSIHSIAKQYFPDKVGAQDGFNQAVKDYISEIIEVLDPRDIPEILYGISRGLKKAITGDYNVELAKQKAGELYDLFTKIDEIVSGLEPYKKSYYKSYVGTDFSLNVFPISRLKTLKKIKGDGDSKVMREVKELKKKKDILNFFKKIKFDDKKLQKKFKHATDFGIKGNYSSKNRELFKEALIKHTKDKNTIMYEGTYRGTEKVKHFYNPKTGNNVMYYEDGSFLSGWKLSKEQAKNLLSNGNVQ